MSSFFDIFGGSAIEPSDVSYNLLTGFSSPLQLQWPSLAVEEDSVAARILDVATAGTVKLPDATLVSTGMDVLVHNTSAGTVEVQTFTGATVLTLDSGAVKYAYLTDNSTTGGTWVVVAFGVGTGSLDASQLAGLGLTAIGSTLNMAHPVTDTSTGFTIQLTDRARLYNFNGGAVALSLLSASTYGNNFFFLVSNNGSGAVTITPAGLNTIDGAASLAVNPGESTFLLTDGSNWFTVGRGRSITFNFTQLVKNVAGSSDVTLTTAEASNEVLKFIGLLTGNINVIVPNVVSSYTIDNQTTGAFTLTVKTAAGTGIVVPQNNRNILYSDGTNVLQSVTVSVASSTFGDGSAASPSITFGSDTDTGIYRIGTNAIGFTAGGVLRFAVSDTAITFTQPITVADNNFTLQDNGDPTKQLQFQLSGITTGTTRTLTVPDISDTLVTLTATQTLTNKTLTAPTITVLDNAFTVQDNVDPTKQLQLQLSGITTGVTRTLTAPDVSDTIVTLAAAQQLDNKTIVSPTIVTPSLSSPSMTGVPTAPTAAVGTSTTQVATTAFVNGSGKILQTVMATDAGGSTSSTSPVNLNAAPVVITPKSTSSKLVIEVQFAGAATAVVGVNALSTFQIYEGAVPLGAAYNLGATISGGGVGLAAVPSFVRTVNIANNALTARSFSLRGNTNNVSSVATGASMTWVIHEVQN